MRQALEKRGFMPQAFSMVATIILEPENKLKVEAFCQAFRERRWGDLRTFQQWEGAKDNLEAYAVKCETGCVLLVVYSHFELFFGDCVYHCEPLSVEEGRSLESFVPERSWHVLNE